MRIANQEGFIDIEQDKPKPSVKWAGGKNQLLSQFEPLFPDKEFDLYIEPFVGGGAVFFHLLPRKAILIDNNFELINFYKVVRDSLEELLSDLGKHENTPDYYYEIRAVDVNKLDEIQRASRFLYLNKTSYNGLWRVNRKGQFNVPYGRYKNPNIKDEDNLKKASEVLKRAEIICGDFSLAKEYATKKTFIYFDPPYHPLSDTANFTSYTSDPFDASDQRRLASLFQGLDEKGCMLMLSNSDTPFIKKLYQGFNIAKVYARRAINCKGSKRGPISELVIRNYS